jgi:pyruvate dehydrogenase E1 component
VLAGTVPTCRAYDPTYAYELAVIIHDSMRRMYQEQAEGFYYITVTNENYVMPAMPEGAREGIVKGMYLLRPAPTHNPRHVQLLGSGAILREALAAAELLAQFDVTADVWSVTSFTELVRDAEDARRHQRLHPLEPARQSYVEAQLSGRPRGPVIAATDYIKLHAEQIRAAVPGRYVVLGTDGFGRSDTRAHLRDFFEVDHRHIALAALSALAEEGSLERAAVQSARDKLGIHPDRPNPAQI